MRGVWKAKYRDRLMGLDRDRFPDWDGLVAAYQAGMASDKFCVYQQMLVVEIMRRAMGDVVFLEAMILDPAWIHDFCGVVTDNILLHLDHMIREVGLPDGVWTYDDMGYTRAPFFSPAMYREFIFPYHKRVGDFCHDHGLPFILHACGTIRPFLPDIVAAGVDVLHPLEAKAGQHIGEFADAVRSMGREIGVRRQHGHPGLLLERSGRARSGDPPEAADNPGEEDPLRLHERPLDPANGRAPDV